MEETQDREPPSAEDLAIVAAMDRAVERLTKAIEGIAIPEDEGRAASILSEIEPLVEFYDGWIRDESEPERSRSIHQNYAATIAKLRKLLADHHHHPR